MTADQLTPGVLLAVVIPIWLGVLAGLWWVAVQIEQIDERARDAGGRPAGDERRG